MNGNDNTMMSAEREADSDLLTSPTHIYTDTLLVRDNIPSAAGGGVRSNMYFV
jgi:hypothetical protein